jgi:hypothetical protein
MNNRLSLIETSRIKKMMGIIKEDEIKKNTLSSSYLKNNFKFKNEMLGIFEKIFKPMNKWGKADNPSIDCYTNDGIIDIYSFTDYSRRMKVPSSKWSVINFFNTSGLVLDKLLDKFRQQTEVDETIENFLLFIEEFIRTKLNTTEFEELVIMNLRAITKGIRGEKEVFTILKNATGADGNMNFCPGSSSDTKKGEDIVLTKENKKATFQVKPLLFVRKSDNKTEIFTKKYPYRGYNKENIDYLVFYNEQTKEMIILENDSDLRIFTNNKSKKGTTYDKVIFNTLPLNPDEIVFR